MVIILALLMISVYCFFFHAAFMGFFIPSIGNFNYTDSLAEEGILDTLQISWAIVLLLCFIIYFLIRKSMADKLQSIVLIILSINGVLFKWNIFIYLFYMGIRLGGFHGS